MKGFTNIAFLYNNVKYSEPYLDNTYRKNIENGKYVMENKLISYQETLATLATADKNKEKCIYNFSKDIFESIDIAKIPYRLDERSIKKGYVEELVEEFYTLNREYDNNILKLLILTSIVILNLMISINESSFVIVNSINTLMICVAFTMIECWYSKNK